MISIVDSTRANNQLERTGDEGRGAERREEERGDAREKTRGGRIEG